MQYKTILADPPWSYRCKSPTSSPRPPSSQRAGGASYYYETMTIDELCAMPVGTLAHHDSVLFLWATVPILPRAFEVMGAWGFKYKTMITWHKLRCKGMGYWFRGHTEHMLLGVRGKVKAFRSLEHNIQSHKVGRHSEKPFVFREMIERAAGDCTPRLELFARGNAPGWDAWGNEIASAPAVTEALKGVTSWQG